jgi:hypothetical protein
MGDMAMRAFLLNRYGGSEGTALRFGLSCVPRERIVKEDVTLIRTADGRVDTPVWSGISLCLKTAIP